MISTTIIYTITTTTTTTTTTTITTKIATGGLEKRTECMERKNIDIDVFVSAIVLTPGGSNAVQYSTVHHGTVQ